MSSKFRNFWRKLVKRFRKWRKQNLIGRNKVRKIALYQTGDRADAIVKREIDGDGGWRPKF